MEATVCLEFDGVIHAGSSTLAGANGPPVPGAFEFIHELLEGGFNVVIHSVTGCQPGGPHVIYNWLLRQACPDADRVRIECSKPDAIMHIDAKGFRFSGVFPPVSGIIRDSECR